MNLDDVDVTVCVTTYNSEKYIRQCLQGVVDQEVDFNVEVLVADDASTDSTCSIVKEFAEKYHYIYLIERPFNVGALANFVDVHGRASGKYIAHVDGDDIIYETKLRDQKKILDDDPEAAACAHQMLVFGTSKLFGLGAASPSYGRLRELMVYGAYFANSSVMYRRDYRGNYSETKGVIDFYRFVDLSQYGHIYFHKKTLGEYRVHDRGISKRGDYFQAIQKGYSDAYDLALAISNDEGLVRTAQAKRKFKVAIGLLRASDYVGFQDQISASKTYRSRLHIVVSSFSRSLVFCKLLRMLLTSRCWSSVKQSLRVFRI